MNLTLRPNVDPDELPERLERLRNRAVTARNALWTKYKHLDHNDPRIVVARHLKAIVSSCYLSAVHVAENISYARWWHATFGPIDPALHKDEVDDYVVLISLNLVVSTYSLFEAGLRRIVRAIDPVAVRGGTGSFKTTYEWLLPRLRASGWTYSEPEAFLDLMRHIRNTIHNNSYVHPPSGKKVVVNWRGHLYAFEPEKPVPFITFDFQERAVTELIDLNESIMSSRKVASLPPIG